MANRNWPSQRVYNQHIMMSQLDAQISIGSSGAPTLSSSNGNGFGILSITRLSTGRYRLQLQDNYNALLGFDAQFVSPLTGSAIAVDATTAGLSSGTVYQIVTVGTATTTANWHTLGVPAGITPAIGVTFKAANTGTGIQSGAGTASAVGNSGIANVELMGNISGMLSNQPFIQGSGGGYIDFQCLSPSFTAGAYTPAGTVASHTHSIPAGTDGAGGTSGATAPAFTGTAASLTGTVAYAAADPASGSVMNIQILLSSSSVQ